MIGPWEKFRLWCCDPDNPQYFAIQTIGGRTVARPLPHVAGTYSACIWSPDGKSVLCGGTDGGPWAIARADSDHAVAVRGSGAPITWLP